MMRFRNFVFAVVVAAVLPAYCVAEDSPAPPVEVREFPLEEVSAFGDPRLVRGQIEWLSRERSTEVVRYPETKSADALFGAIRIGGDWSDPATGVSYYFCVDESRGTGRGRDALYFDLNRNLDLTDDGVVKPIKAPAGAVPPGWNDVDELVFFEYVEPSVDFGEEIGMRPFRLLPRFHLSTTHGYSAALALVCPTARRGQIAVGANEYTATIGQVYRISGRFDGAVTFIGLVLAKGEENPEGGSHEYESLRTMRYFDGTWYSLSTPPTGDKLIVSPYEGPFGTLEVRVPASAAEPALMNGSLASAQRTVVLGPVKGRFVSSYGRVERARLPAGDYRPSMFSVEGGGLRISMSFNYHSDGKARERDRPPVYGFKIRAGETFVYDFSNAPEVMFASPAAGARFRPGDEVEVKAVLTDPVQDLMIRRLDDMARTEARTFKDPATGEEHSYKQSLSLDPRVTVRDSKGAVVAEGKLPFG